MPANIISINQLHKVVIAYLMDIDVHDQAPAGSRIFNPRISGMDFAKSRDPGIFQDGISLKFYPGILPKKYGISRDFLLSSKIWSISYVLEDLFVCKIH